jgi:preprotein translocase subunit YajC
VLNIKLDTQVSSKDPEGKKFSGKLLENLTVGDKVVAKAGAAVYGQVDSSKQAGRLAGKSELKMSLSGIDINGKIQPIVTTNFSESGKSSFRKTARNATAGAVIGAAADDDGAGKGAAVGVGVSMIRKGDSVTAPAGMLLEFRLSQPFQTTVTP